MPKDNKCSSKQPCNPPSDNSEVCYPVKCESKCEKDCCINKCESYTPEELVCLYRDAVVEIHSEFILLGGTGTGIPVGVTAATGGTPLAPNVRDDVILEGNGFFIKGHYIVAPAHLVLLPPSLTSIVNRFPLFDPGNVTLGNIRNQLIRASRILISVFNVNGKGHSFVYEADLVGVDGAGDIAVLKINYKKQWNLCNPCVEKCHPYFKFGSSRAAKDGEKIYLLGDYISHAVDRRLFNAVGAISEGLLSDHRYLDYSGFALAEAILVSAPAYAFSSGLPILDGQGHVLGMQTADLAATLPNIIFPTTPIVVTGTAGVGGAVLATGTIGPLTLNQAEGSGLVGGPSEFFMRRVIKALIRGTCSRQFNCQIETVCDPAGAFFRYRKAYAGIAYDVFTGVGYDVTADFTSGSIVGGRPRVRLTSTGDFLTSPSCKELVGIRVLGLAGLNPNDLVGIPNGFYYVPGGTGTIVPLNGLVLPVSPFLGKLLPGDVITHINGIALGDLEKQIAPSLITWRLCAGDQIDICYRRGGNALNSTDNSLTENYDNLLTYTGCLADFPPLLDYPWYAVNIFPLLSTLPFPGFAFPAQQITNPQFPARDPFLGAGFFHPAF
ncbi:Hypothetical protein HVR_LOCUS1234 [uncultured virus]|nr:Hypothetical protein HVR_LOCUS1234 [uncultured virus]